MASLKGSDRAWMAGLAIAAAVAVAATFGPPIYCAVWGASDLRCVGSLR